MIYCIIVVSVAGVLLPIWLGRNLNILLRLEHPLIKTMIQKFSICYKVKKNVNNVDSFVDKYVYSLKIGGLYLSTWDRLCGQLSGCLLLVSIGGLFIRYLQKSGQIGGQPVELSTVGIGIMLAGLLIFYNSLFGRREKLQRFCYEMKDYLGNVLQPKLEQESGVPDKNTRIAEHTQAESLIRAVQEQNEERRQKPLQASLSERQQEIIDEILLEYLS